MPGWTCTTQLDRSLGMASMAAWIDPPDSTTMSTSLQWAVDRRSDSGRNQRDNAPTRLEMLMYRPQRDSGSG